MRVVLTGCSVREPDRAGLRAALPSRRPVPATGRGARARRPARARLRAGADRAGRQRRPRSGVRSWAPPTICRGHGPTRSGRGPSSRGSAISAWLPIIYGCDKTCTYCIVPFSRGPERSRPFDDIVDEARGPGRRRLPRGHAARPERQLVRPRPASPRRASGTSTAERWAGRQLDRARSSGPCRADPGDRRSAHGRWRAGDPAPAVRDLPPVGPVRPAHRRPRRLPERLRAPAPARPVGRRRGAAPDGPPVHDRALPGTAGADPRGGARDRDLDRRHRRVLRRDRGPVRARRSRSSRPSATTRSSRRRTRRVRGHRRPGSTTTCPPPSSANGSTSCWPSRSGSALERNGGWVGREVEVLVDTVAQPRSHEHADEPDETAGDERNRR